MPELLHVVLYLCIILTIAFAWHAIKVCNTLIPAIPPQAPMWVEGLRLLKYGFVWIIIFSTAALVTLWKVL